MASETSSGISLLDDLNAEQAAAASHGNAPLLVVAGAGTGKTATLVHRVAYLIAGGADPRRILLLTFTRRAAAEMLRRVDALLGRDQPAGPCAGTRLGRHLPRGGRAAAAHSRSRPGPGARFHDPRSR